MQTGIKSKGAPAGKAGVLSGEELNREHLWKRNSWKTLKQGELIAVSDNVLNGIDSSGPSKIILYIFKDLKLIQLSCICSPLHENTIR